MSGSYLVLSEFVVAFLFHAISTGRILLILRAKLNTQRDTSLYFMALLLNWLVAALLLLPYEGNGIAVWRPQQGVLYNGRLLFFIAMPAHLFLAMIPVSVFFLTVDRICIIRFGGNFNNGRAKKLLLYGYLGSLLICVIVNLGGFLSALPVIEKSACEIFGCILGSSVDIYLGWRAFCAIFNVSGGILFFALLCRSNRHMMEQASQFPNSASFRYFKRTNRANNVLTSIAVLSEFFLAFIPHFVPLLWEKIFGAGSSMGTGPLSEVMSSVEVLIFSSIYSHVLSAGADSSSGMAPVETCRGVTRISPHNGAIPSVEVNFVVPSSRPSATIGPWKG